MKKLLITLFCILFIYCNVFVVFADEYNEEDENDIDNSVLIDNNNKSTNNNINSFDSNNYILNQEQKQLNQLRSLNSGERGIITTFNNLSDSQLEYYYNNFDYLGIYRHNLDDTCLAIYKSDITSINGYYVNFNKSYTIYAQGGYHENSAGTVLFDPNVNSDEYQLGFYMYYTDQYLYKLTPYKLTLSNNQNISVSPNNIPYDSLIFYNGQTVTLTYDDSNHDFTGWYDINGNLLSNQLSYSFDISQDLTIQVNYNTDHSANINYDYFIYIILLLSLILLHDLTKGVF